MSAIAVTILVIGETNGVAEIDENNNVLSIVEKPKEPKIQYAEAVTMTEKEYLKLQIDHGGDIIDRAVEKLNNYKLSKGVTYQSDYRAMLSWAINKIKEDDAKKSSVNQKRTKGWAEFATRED
jgi:aspartyl/asparaginyl-tRNA synthetase